jgi:hypothetical protein
MAMTNYVRWKQAKRKRDKRDLELQMAKVRLKKATGDEKKYKSKHLKDLKKQRKK